MPFIQSTTGNKGTSNTAIFILAIYFIDKKTSSVLAGYLQKELKDQCPIRHNSTYTYNMNIRSNKIVQTLLPVFEAYSSEAGPFATVRIRNDL